MEIFTISETLAVLYLKSDIMELQLNKSSSNVPDSLKVSSALYNFKSSTRRYFDQARSFSDI